MFFFFCFARPLCSCCPTKRTDITFSFSSVPSCSLRNFPQFPSFARQIAPSKRKKKKRFTVSFSSIAGSFSPKVPFFSNLRVSTRGRSGRNTWIETRLQGYVLSFRRVLFSRRVGAFDESRRLRAAKVVLSSTEVEIRTPNKEVPDSRNFVASHLRFNGFSIYSRSDSSVAPCSTIVPAKGRSGIIFQESRSLDTLKLHRSSAFHPSGGGARAYSVNRPH